MNKFVIAVLCIATLAIAQEIQDNQNQESNLDKYLREIPAPSPPDNIYTSSPPPSAADSGSTPQPNASQVHRKRAPQAPLFQNFQTISLPVSHSPIFQAVSVPQSNSPPFQTISLAPNPGPRPQVVAAPVAAAPAIAAVPVEPEPFDPYPRYHYGYAVSDPATGNSHSATESRNGNVVKGQYSVVEPDGFLRVVTYTADDSGFHSTVERRPVGRAVVAPSAPRQVAVAV